MIGHRYRSFRVTITAGPGSLDAAGQAIYWFTVTLGWACRRLVGPFSE
jgi:hypothetical protein